MGVRILVVEDEPEIAAFLIRGLREDGFTVERVADGTAAGHRLRTESWDIILLDWWLPGIDGLTVLRRFREAASGLDPKPEAPDRNPSLRVRL